VSFFSELKRRKVVRVAVVYAATAFAVLQVADIMLPQMGVPEWGLSLVVALIVLGFPIALVLGWALELTPEGIKRTEARPAENSKAATPALLGKRTVLVAGLLLVLGVGLSAGWLLKPGAPEQEAAGAATPETAYGSVEVAAAGPARGVGVLPFTNLSPDPDNAFFASGVHEEVLTRLALIPELRVISRTSMEKIAGDGLEVSEIGRRLGVSHVLEGSVRRSGDRVRVTVQLIEAASDRHIWAENFDRTLDDTFTIQSDIALAIAAQLEASLNPELRASIEARPTDNPAAYDLYLRAREESRVWRGAEGFRSMIELLEPAVELDPDFLAARGLLVHAYGQMYRLDAGIQGAYDRKALALVTELRRRWPDRPESRLALAHYNRLVERNFELALAEFQSLLAEHPNDVEIMGQVGTTLKWLGRDEEFLEVARRVLALDLLPMEPIEGVTFRQLDFTTDEALEWVESECAGGIDLVISDMAPNITGVKSVDLPRAMYLAELAMDTAGRVLKPSGAFLTKLFHGEGFDDYVKLARANFKVVKVRKPAASRPRSRETYLLARNYRL